MAMGKCGMILSSATTPTIELRRGFRRRGDLFFHAFCEVIRVEEVLIWVIPEINRMRVGASRADRSPIPFGADIITRVPVCDKDMMLGWVKRRAKRGWSVEKMRGACDCV